MSFFSVNSHLRKQIDGYLMSGSTSLVFSDIYMCKMEEGVVVSERKSRKKEKKYGLYWILSEFE